MAETDKKEDVKIPSKDELLNADSQEPADNTEEHTEEPQYTEIEKQAMAQGWKPKDQWDGDPNQHRSAREYLDRGELLGKIKTQNQQLTEIRAALQQMSEHNRKVYAAGYENAIKELKAQKLAALREGDAEAVMAIDEKIDNTKEQLEQVKQTPQVPKAPQTSERTVQWLAANPWYQTETAMKHAANGYAQEYAARTGSRDEDAIYEYVDKKIREDFPHKFKQVQPTKAAPSPDGDSRRGGGGKPSSGNLTFDKVLAQMDETSANIARNLVRTGGITKEKYVEDWVKITGGRA